MKKLREIWAKGWPLEPRYVSLIPGPEFGILIVDGVPYRAEYLSYSGTGISMAICATDGRYHITFHPAERDWISDSYVPDAIRGMWAIGSQRC